MIDNNFIKKILKYFALFFVIFMALNYVPNNKLSDRENLIISMIGTTFYAFMESYFPTVYIDKFVV
jgi:hypothetical protein